MIIVEVVKIYALIPFMYYPQPAYPAAIGAFRRTNIW